MRTLFRSFPSLVGAGAAVLFLAAASPVFAAATTFTNAVDTDFSNAANWSGGVPNGTANFTIQAGATANLSADYTTTGAGTIDGTLNAVGHNLSLGQLVVDPSGVATSTTGTITVSGTVTSTGSIGTGTGNFSFGSTVQNNGTFDIGGGAATTTNHFTNVGTVNGGSGVLAFGFQWIEDSGTFNAQSGTVRFYNGANPGGGITIKLPGHIYNNLQFVDSEPDTLSLTTSSTVLGALQVNTGGGNGPVSMTANTSTIVVVGATTIGSASTVTSTTGGFNLMGAVSSTGAIGTLSGNLLFGSTVQNNGTIRVGAGTVTSTGAFTGAAGSVVHNESGTFVALANFTNSGTLTADQGTFRVAGTGTQSISGSLFNNFESNKTAGTATLSSSSTVLGTLTVNVTGGTLSSGSNSFSVQAGTTLIGGTVTSTSGTLTFTGSVTSTGSIGSTSGNIAFGNSVQNNGVVDVGSGSTTSTGAFNNNSGATLRGQTGTFTAVAGWTNAGTFTAGTGTFRVSGTASQNITGATFYNFTSVKSSGTATFVTSAPTIGGALTTSGGGTLTSAALALTVTGASTIGSGTTVTSTSGGLTFTGAVTSTGTIGSGTGVQMFSSTFQNNGTWAHGSGAVTSTLAVTDTGTINCGSGNWDVMAAWTESGTFNRQTCTVRFVGAAAQTVPAVTFSSVSFRNALGSSLSGTTYVSSTMEVISGASLAIGDYTLVVPNTITNNGTITISNAGTFIHTVTSNAFTDSSGSAVSSYTQGDLAYVTIQDANRNYNSGVADTLVVMIQGDMASGRDTEYVTLTETGAGTGIFRNTSGINVSGASPTAGNGTLEGTLSGTFTATYTDANDATDILTASKTFTITSVAGSTGGGAAGGGGGGGSGLPYVAPTVQSLTTTNGITATSNINNTNGNVTQNLANLQTIGVSTGALVKLPDDGNPNTQEDTAVYYIANDGRRHAFPNSRAFFTWYPDFSGVQIVGPDKVASIPLGSNVTYKPGVKLVKFATLPKVYAVDRYGELHWVKTEALAISLYGADWNKKVDDINDAFYTNYRFGTDVNAAGDYSPSVETSSAVSINWNFGL